MTEAPDHRALRDALVRASIRADAGAMQFRSLVVEPLDDSDTRFAAVDRDGNRAIAIASLRSGATIPGVRLENLDVDYGVEYRLHSADRSEDMRVSVIRCGASDAAILDLFVAFCGALLDNLSDAPSDVEVARQVDEWVSLFRKLELPPSQSLTGLIGEVTIIDVAMARDEWVRAWHVSSMDTIDFGFGSPHVEIEVKTTTRQERVHDISLHQAVHGPGVDRYFASVKLELRETGTDLGTVVREILDSLEDPDLQRHFMRVLGESCGTSLDLYLRQRYVREVSQRSVALFVTSEVPHPEVALPLPPGVSDLHFLSDFGWATPVPRSRLGLRN